MSELQRRTYRHSISLTFVPNQTECATALSTRQCPLGILRYSCLETTTVVLRTKEIQAGFALAEKSTPLARNHSANSDLVEIGTRQVIPSRKFPEIILMIAVNTVCHSLLRNIASAVPVRAPQHPRIANILPDRI